MRYLLVAAFFSLLPSACFAQDLQSRLIVHPTADISEKWFLAGWGIGNLRVKTPSNANFFGGVGYRGSDWWIEGMIQRQWSRKGNSVLFDVRFQKQFGNRVSLYVEPAPFLNRRAFYNFTIVEYRAFGKLRLGGETENIHRAGADSLAFGPRVSYSLGTLAGFSVVASITYRMQRPEPDALRVYLAFHRRFARRK